MKRSIALFEIFILVCAGFSFAHFMEKSGDYFPGVMGESKLIKISRALLIGWLGKGLVSAQEIGMYTCLEGDGGICQEYPAGECADNCDGACFPGVRSDYAPCALGTCFDPDDGGCDYRSPRQFCEEGGGEWSEEIPAQCNKGCCLYQGNAQYTTERNCVSISRTGGYETEFREVGNELECLVMVETQEKGACVFEFEFENTCEFTDQNYCNDIGGSFHRGFLCSHPDLKTNCEKQVSTGCVDGKDEVYWFDSCGNRENIYSSNKEESFNGGKVLPKTQSCGNTDEDGNVNDVNCGNCNRFRSSVCGESSSEISPTYGDFICKDLSCGFVDGQERDNGESWCVYDSQIGLDGEDGSNEERSVDVPGSKHYRKVCIDGEVRLEPCQDYRNGVCVQSSDEESGTSSAACVLNEWQLCIEANTDKDKLEKCEDNEVCFLKSVAISENFAFEMCAPKYPPGFDLREGDGGDAQTICGMASKTCTAIYVKKVDGRTDCVANCECTTEAFGETMNNLCMSLGDCGASYNIEGKFGDSGHNLEGHTQQLNDDYLAELKNYITPIEGQSAEVFNLNRTLSLFGIAEREGNPRDIDLDMFKNLEGASGLGVASFFLGDLGYALFVNGWGLVNLPAPSIAGYAGATVGLVVGGAAIAYVLKITGVGRGLPPTVANALIATGAVGGFLIGVTLSITKAGVSLCAGGPIGCTVGAIILAVVLITVAILKLAGVGDVDKKQAIFECQPWQPPRGGVDCEKCGKDGLPCSKYKCQSLGQTCEFLNEGTDEEACVDVSPNDVTSPEIRPWQEALAEGYSYVEKGENGFKIVRDDTQDGCINAFTPVPFGINLSEPASCKISFENHESYEDMPNSFYGGSNLLKKEHEHMAYMPSLDSLGIPEDLRGSVGDYRLYTMCSDANGNSNDASYVIDFCVSSAPDNTASVISGFSPTNDGFIAFGDEEHNVTFYTNEPAECKWSLSNDESYETMEGSVSCENEIEQGTLYGWLCNATLPTPLTDNDFEYYFRCKDQPWLEGQETDENTRNVNNEGILYSVKRSASELVINSVSPNNETIVGVRNPLPLTLEIHTSGGVDGSASCEYNINNGRFSEFWPLGSSEHVQVLTTGLFAGLHRIDYRCEDLAGNVAETSSEFRIEIDEEGPLISRAYKLGGNLNIITDEPAVCKFSHDSCGFSFDGAEVSEMSGAGYAHTSSLGSGLTYYVKCEDGFGNIGSCLAVSGG